jgi:hypothetical protein
MSLRKAEQFGFYEYVLPAAHCGGDVPASDLRTHHHRFDAGNPNGRSDV